MCSAQPAGLKQHWAIDVVSPGLVPSLHVTHIEQEQRMYDLYISPCVDFLVGHNRETKTH